MTTQSAVSTVPWDETPRPVRRILASVTIKDDLDIAVRGVLESVPNKVEIISTGGTADFLRTAGFDVIEIKDVTGSPEMMDGRLKTLHPKVHGGLLGRPGVDDEVMAKHGIQFIDILFVNLYQFAKAITDPNITRKAANEQIDIGGPGMIRSGAKGDVLVMTDPRDYGELVQHLKENHGMIMPLFRQRMALKVFCLTANYDATIAHFMVKKLGLPSNTLDVLEIAQLATKAAYNITRGDLDGLASLMGIISSKAARQRIMLGG